MATFDTNRPHAASGSVARFGGFFAHMVGTYAAWNDARLTRKSLESLTDRELEDIGLVRGDIDNMSGRF